MLLQKNGQFASDLCYEYSMLLKLTHMDNQKNRQEGKEIFFLHLNAHPLETTKQFFDRKVYYDKLNWRCIQFTPLWHTLWSDFKESNFRRNFREGKLHFDGVNDNDVTMETFSLNYTHFYVSMSCGKNIFTHSLRSRLRIHLLTNVENREICT